MVALALAGDSQALVVAENRTCMAAWAEVMDALMTWNVKTACVELRSDADRGHGVVAQADDEVYAVVLGLEDRLAGLGIGVATGVGEARDHSQPCEMSTPAVMRVAQTCPCRSCAHSRSESPK